MIHLTDNEIDGLVDFSSAIPVLERAFVQLARAARIVVELREQARVEAGDLLLAAPGLVEWDHVLELGDVLGARVAGRQNDDDIIVYKAVGIGLQDSALAGLAWRNYLARTGTRSQTPG
jgi:ornithine cyclodeaminase/alanine dehydrogenase-like protein (mu-crystallin family)